jgi:hypothetical protein
MGLYAQERLNFVKVKEWRLVNLIVIFCVLFQVQTSAAQAVKNTKLLGLGCYRYTDVLKSSNPTNQIAQSGTKLGPQTSNLPEAHLGREFVEVDCFTKHHIQISLISKSPIKGTIKLDTVLIRSRCLIHNMAIANAGHQNHSSQLYVNVWRTGKTNHFNCGIVGASSKVPTAPEYRIFKSFFSPVLKQGA